MGAGDFTRPYLDKTGNLVYLTDEDAAARKDDVRRLVVGDRPGTVVAPDVVPAVEMPVQEPQPAPATVPGPRDNPEEMMK